MLLYREECEKWVDHFKGCFPETIDNGVAVYNRGMVEDAALAAEVFLRIKERYPGEYGAAGCKERSIRFKKRQKTCMRSWCIRNWLTIKMLV